MDRDPGTESGPRVRLAGAMARPAALAVALSALLLLPPCAAGSGAPGGAQGPFELPFTLRDATAVYDGESAYVFGGYSLRNGTEGLVTDEILRFDPGTGIASVVLAKLPFPVLLPDSFWDGTRAYIFGGTDQNGTPLDHLVIFTPPDRVELLEHFFPYGLKGTSTVWIGETAYIFGDCVCTAQSGSRNILRFEPGRMNLSVLNGSLPYDLAGTSAVWTGREAFLFGGNTASGSSDAILRFDPGTGVCAPMQSRLPFPRFKTGAVLLDGKAYIFGGRPFAGFTDEILVYDPAADALTVSEKKLPQQSACKAYCLVGGDILLFGGEKAGDPFDRVEVISLRDHATEPAGQERTVGTELLVGTALFAIAALLLTLVTARRR